MRFFILLLYLIIYNGTKIVQNMENAKELAIFYKKITLSYFSNLKATE